MNCKEENSGEVEKEITAELKKERAAQLGLRDSCVKEDRTSVLKRRYAAVCIEEKKTAE